jgi:hypothetical protein
LPTSITSITSITTTGIDTSMEPQEPQPMEQQQDPSVPSPRTLQFPHLAHISPALAPEALLDAVNEGSVQLVRDLVRRDPGLANHRDGFGQTPLMWAVSVMRCDAMRCDGFGGGVMGSSTGSGLELGLESIDRSALPWPHVRGERRPFTIGPHH